MKWNVVMGNTTYGLGVILKVSSGCAAYQVINA